MKLIYEHKKNKINEKGKSKTQNERNRQQMNERKIK